MSPVRPRTDIDRPRRPRPDPNGPRVSGTVRTAERSVRFGLVLEGNNYAALDDLKSSLDLSDESFADADITLALSSASRAVDNICERRFWLDEDDSSVRYYTPRRSGKLLQIDDLVTFTSLETDNAGDGTFESNWTENSDFVFEPLNAAADGEPFTMIRVHPNGRFRLPGNSHAIINQPTVPRSVKLTGQFGWAAIPDGVTQATGILAGRLMRRAREAPFGVIGFAMEGGPAATALARNDPDVMMLLKPYIRPLMA